VLAGLGVRDRHQLAVGAVAERPAVRWVFDARGSPPLDAAGHRDGLGLALLQDGRLRPGHPAGHGGEHERQRQNRRRDRDRVEGRRQLGRDRAAAADALEQQGADDAEVGLEEQVDRVGVPVVDRGRGGDQREREDEQGRAPAPADVAPGVGAGEAQEQGRGEQDDAGDEHDGAGPVGRAALVGLLVVAKTRHREWLLPRNEEPARARAPARQRSRERSAPAGSLRAVAALDGPSPEGVPLAPGVRSTRAFRGSASPRRQRIRRRRDARGSSCWAPEASTAPADDGAPWGRSPLPRASHLIHPSAGWAPGSRPPEDKSVRPPRAPRKGRQTGPDPRENMPRRVETTPGPFAGEGLSRAPQRASDGSLTGGPT
jgi:hypothetical protein